MRRAWPLLVLVAGCGTEASVDHPDAPPVLDPVPDANRPTQCNDLDLTDAPFVGTTSVAGPPPTASGGSIVDGTYVLTALNLYYGSGTNPSTFRQKLTIAGTTMQVATLDLSAATPVVRSAFTLSTSDTSGYTLIRTCKTPGTSSGTYTATPTSFVLYSGAQEYIYTLR